MTAHNKNTNPPKNYVTKTLTPPPPSFARQRLKKVKIIEYYATPWRESRNFYIVSEPSYPENLPSLFICRNVSSFCPFNRVCARLQAQGLALGTAMSAGTWVKCKKREKSRQMKCLSSHFHAK